MNLTLADLAALTVFACLIVLAWHFATKQGFAIGHAAGRCEERSRTNSIVIPAKLTEHERGVAFGFEFAKALASRKAGNVAGIPTFSPQEVGHMQPRPRKPGTQTSAAPDSLTALTAIRNFHEKRTKYDTETYCRR